MVILILNKVNDVKLMNHITKNILLNVIIILLLLLSLRLGFALYKIKSDQPQLGLTSFTKRDNPPPATNEPEPLPENLLQDSVSTLEYRLLQGVPTNVTLEQQNAFYIEVAGNAQATGKIDITQCISNPVILSVKNGESFLVSNLDQVAREIRFSDDRTHNIPPSGSVILSANFDEGPGLYGYGCGDLPGNTGMILVGDE
jgi:hypothetical protein